MVQHMTGFIRRLCQAAQALPLVALFAAPAAIAQTDSAAMATKRAELEKAVTEITKMFVEDPRFNRGKTAEEIRDGVEFVTGNVLFVLGHETAHALISVFEIPVIGREEDGADALATVVSIKMANAFQDRVVQNAARGWFLSNLRAKKEGIPTIFYDEHGLDLQRAYNIVCLLVGGAPDKFMKLAQDAKLPKQRQDTCKFDYSNAEWSWDEVLKPHKRQPGAPKTKIEVTYVPSKEFATLAMLGQKLQILESVAEWLSDDYVFKTPISLEMRECGGPNARWIPGPKKIEICYELIREFVQLHRGFGKTALVPGRPMMSDNKQIIMMPKPSAGKSGGKSYRADRTQQ